MGRIEIALRQNPRWLTSDVRLKLARHHSHNPDAEMSQHNVEGKGLALAALAVNASQERRARMPGEIAQAMVRNRFDDARRNERALLGSLLHLISPSSCVFCRRF